MMFLSIICASAFVLAILVAVLGPIESSEPPGAKMPLPDQPAKFFSNDGVRRRAGDDLAVDLMLAQIEQHVRLEQAAAESFLAAPTPATLRTTTKSPLSN